MSALLKWFKNLFRLLKKDGVKQYDGCTLCYDSGVVRLTLRNKHFQGSDYYRECPNGCKMTIWGMQRLTK